MERKQSCAERPRLRWRKFVCCAVLIICKYIQSELNLRYWLLAMNVTKLENSPDSTLFEQFSIVRQRKLQLRDSITVYQVKTNQVFMPNIDLKKIFRYKTFGDACCRSGSPVCCLFGRFISPLNASASKINFDNHLQRKTDQRL